MHRSLHIQLRQPYEWNFDEADNPSAPGGREFMDALAGELRNASIVVSSVSQHEDYGWRLDAKLGTVHLETVFNAPDRGAHLTVSTSVLDTLLLRTPRKALTRYCELLDQVVPELMNVESASWSDA